MLWSADHSEIHDLVRRQSIDSSNLSHKQGSAYILTYISYQHFFGVIVFEPYDITPVLPCRILEFFSYTHIHGRFITPFSYTHRFCFRADVYDLSSFRIVLPNVEQLVVFNLPANIGLNCYDIIERLIHTLTQIC